MKPKQPLNLRSILEKLAGYGQKLRPYSFSIFLLFVILLYTFVLFKIHTLGNTEPSADAVSSEVRTAPSLHLDQSVVKQLQSLQDNSVSVHTLFDQARSNPFNQ